MDCNNSTRTHYLTGVEGAKVEAVAHLARQYFRCLERIVRLLSKGLDRLATANGTTITTATSTNATSASNISSLPPPPPYLNSPPSPGGAIDARPRHHTA